MSNPTGECTRLLVVDDDPGMHTLVHDLFASESNSVLSATTLSDGLRIAANQRIDVVLLDHMLSDGEGIDHIAEFISHDRLRPILYVTAQAGSKTAIEAIKRGAFEYLSKPIDFNLLRQRVAEAVEYRRLTRLPVLLDSASSEDMESDILVGRCRGMQEVYKSIGRLSNLASPMLIEGEVGTGKEMIARTIHQNSSFASGPFRKISSKEFGDAEFQSELSGGCKGGTLMIDDIESLSLATQSRLLRSFQSHAIAGASVDTRVILATSLKIRELVPTGAIRSDLFYFVSPFMIRVPALRDRQEDLELLVSYFMQRLAHVSPAQQGQGPPRVSSTALRLMKDHDWPGNIAELKSVLQGVLTECRGAVLATDALLRYLDVTNGAPASLGSSAIQGPLQESNKKRAELEVSWDLRALVDQQISEGTERLYEQATALLDQQLLALVMQHTNGNRVKAAKILGITRTSLRRKMLSGIRE